MKEDEDNIQDEAGHLWGKIPARWKDNPSVNDNFLVFLCHNIQLNTMQLLTHWARGKNQ